MCNEDLFESLEMNDQDCWRVEHQRLFGCSPQYDVIVCLVCSGQICTQVAMNYMRNFSRNTYVQMLCWQSVTWLDNGT